MINTAQIVLIAIACLFKVLKEVDCCFWAKTDADEAVKEDKNLVNSNDVKHIMALPWKILQMHGI